MNVTLSVDEKLLARARELAHERGTSVNQLIRDYLERLTGTSGPSNVMDQLERLWRDQSGPVPAAGSGTGTRCMTGPCFVDTNLLVYADDQDAGLKSTRAPRC